MVYADRVPRSRPLPRIPMEGPHTVRLQLRDIQVRIRQIPPRTDRKGEDQDFPRRSGGPFRRLDRGAPAKKRQAGQRPKQQIPGWMQKVHQRGTFKGPTLRFDREARFRERGGCLPKRQRRRHPRQVLREGLFREPEGDRRHRQPPRNQGALPVPQPGTGGGSQMEPGGDGLEPADQQEPAGSQVR